MRSCSCDSFLKLNLHIHNDSQSSGCMAPSETPLDFCNRLWNNWKPENGKNQCKGCPAHWSNRSDFPGNPETRQSSHGHRPWYGDGDLSGVEVVILGHEPGRGSIGDEGEDETNHTEKSFEEVRNPSIEEVPKNAGTLGLTKPLFDRVGSEFQSYWSQIKKCNELLDHNDRAERQCAGIGDENEGYLVKELSVVNPSYVIGLGEDVYKTMTRLYDMEMLDEKFNKSIASSDSASGFRTLDVDEFDFKYIPTAHPSRGVRPETKGQIDLDGVSGRNDSIKYYKVFADDFADQVRQGHI